MPRRVEFTEFGGPEVLHIVEGEAPHSGPGEVRVHVIVAGLNPFDAKVFRGMRTSLPHSVSFPSGNGSDFAGVVDEIGEGVTSFAPGDEVFGGRTFHAQADYLIIPEGRLLKKPAGLSVERAGALDTAARAAFASTASLDLTADDTVLVTAAAGGVGVLAAQLARQAGATVIGSASESNHDFLRSLGVVPVEYGAGMVDAVRAVAPDGITAALDNHGNGSVEAALELGAPPTRINTVADYEAPEKYGVGSVGGAGATIQDTLRVAELIADEQMVLPIDSMFPLERVSEAYTRLLAGHLRGKIILLTE